jgi:hypothetical protein
VTWLFVVTARRWCLELQHAEGVEYERERAGHEARELASVGEAG